MKKLYVSLPISGHEYADVCARCDAASAKYGKEWTVVTPVMVCRGIPDGPYSLCMGKCVEALLECDAAVFLEGWFDSRGCRAEHAICAVYGIPRMYDMSSRDVSVLVGAVAAAAGVTSAQVMSSCRNSPLPACRWMVGGELMRRGWSCAAAARALNLSHATLLYGVMQLELIEKQNWQPEADILRRFRADVGGETVVQGSNP